MLPTKGYFQDIECPYYNSSCGRPYCHFRHKKKLTDNVEELVNESEKEETTVIPTYKPTPKSELANIHNKSHIPISYVPDLAFRPERKIRPPPKFEKPTYKPTPLSILSSASSKLKIIGDENGDNIEAIKEIKQNIANMEYDPATSLQPTEDIDFEGLDSEFAIIDEIIRSTDYKKKRRPLTLDSPNNAETGDCKSDQEFNSNDHTVLESSEIKGKLLKNKINEVKSDIDKNKKSDSFKDKVKTVSSQNVKIKEQLVEKRDSSSEKHKKSVDLKKNKEDVNNITLKKEEHKKVEIKTKDTSDNSKSSEKSKKNKRDTKEREKNVKTEKEKNEKIETKKKSKNSEKSHKSSSREKHRKEELKDREVKKEKHKIHSESRSRSRESTKSKDHSEDKQRKSEKSIHQEKNTEKSSSKHRDKDKSSESKRSRDDNQGENSKPKKEDKERNKEHIRESRKSKERSEDRIKSKKYKESEKDKIKNRHDNSKTEESRNKNKDSSSKNKKKFFIPSSDESVNDSDREILLDDSADNRLMEVDLEEDENETLLECYKIFNEYIPTPKEPTKDSELFSPDHSSMESLDLNPNNYCGKKRIAHATTERTHSQINPIEKPKSASNPGQMLANRYKLAKIAQMNREQELLMNEVQQSAPIKRSAPSLLEAARARKIKRENSDMNYVNTNIVDDILQGSNNKMGAPAPPRPKIAPAQNVSLMAKAKERISKIAQSSPKTIAQTQKGPRVAHVPETSLADIPDVLQADKSKHPVNVRTRFLTMIADECLKLYISKEEAFTRAINEEFSCYEKCNVLATYRNSAMLAVNRLRKEIQDRNSNGLGLIGIGEDDGRSTNSEFKGRGFYNKVKNWILTEEELDIHGYPRESEDFHGKATIKNPRSQPGTNLDENQRLCCRCQKIYPVDDDGWPLFEEECLYHPMKKRTIRGEQIYLCCRSNDETGCATSDTHVSEGFCSADLEGFQTTLEPESEDDQRSSAVYALDCEMCYTTKGLELTRVTVVDSECKTVYESLVKPLNPIIDYNTRFSGITKEQMDRTSTSILQVQANILHLCNSKTILVGHSLESDMKALKIIHGTIVDTSVLFPHKMGLPHKRALRALASEYLRKIIQNNVSGHDSAEDAVTCMELLKWKLKEETKSRPSK